MFNVENLDPQDFDPMYHGALICNKKASFKQNNPSPQPNKQTKRKKTKTKRRTKQSKRVERNTDCQ
jgi:hypothetical protein